MDVRPRMWGPRALAGATLVLVVTAVLSYGLGPSPTTTAVAVLRAALLGLLCTTAVMCLVGTIQAMGDRSHAGRTLAAHDDVTGVLTRTALFDALERRWADNPSGASTALAIVDCDDFAQVNDTWGHLAGDTLLRDIGQGLAREFGEDTLIARQSGDQFVITCQVSDADCLDDIRTRVCSVLGEPFEVAPGRFHRQTASIGLSVADANTPLAPTDLLREADIALRSAKAEGRGNAATFDDELRRTSRRRAALSDALEGAIRAGRVQPAFQPILGGPAYDRIIGWEALARWNDPFLGTVSPADFIPLAEEQGLICELGDHMLRASCRHLAMLRSHFGLPDVSVSVNVSAPQLRQPEFVDTVLAAIRDSGLQPHNVDLEITESLLVDDDGSTSLDTLRRLRAEGIRICLDDFGTGYASITTLLRMPLDCVKLDRSLVCRLDTVDRAADQVKAVIDLVRTLDIHRIVAEGVETRAEADKLLTLGCPNVQGWLFGRPMDPEEIRHRGRTVRRAGVPTLITADA